MSDDKEQEFYPEYNGKSLIELAQAQVDVKNEIENLQKKKTLLQNELDHLRLHRIPSMMEDMGIQNVVLDGIGRLAMQGNLYAGVQKGMKHEAEAWLEEHGHGDLVKGTINSSSLKAFLKEQMRNGESFPAEIFKATPYMMATITKSQNGKFKLK